jgi:hypothetical protein
VSPAHAAHAVQRDRGARARYLRVVGVIGLLCVVATAVALLLAQSAGAIHLSLLGGVS